jgi:hypothetical protein
MPMRTWPALGRRGGQLDRAEAAGRRVRRAGDDVERVDRDLALAGGQRHHRRAAGAVGAEDQRRVAALGVGAEGQRPHLGRAAGAGPGGGLGAVADDEQANSTTPTSATLMPRWYRGGMAPPKLAPRRRPRFDRAMPRTLPIDRAVELFLDHCKVERGLSANTLDGYGRDLGRLAGFLEARGRAGVDEVTAIDLADHLTALAAAGQSARSRARALVAMRGLGRYLVGREVARRRSQRADRRAAHRAAVAGGAGRGRGGAPAGGAGAHHAARACATRRCSSCCTPPGCACRSWSGMPLADVQPARAATCG